MTTSPSHDHINKSITEEINNTINTEKLPQYSKCSKFLLIEELALEKDYRQLHHGMCTVIGKLDRLKDCIVLENIKIPNFPPEYSLAQGALTVRLDFSNCSELNLQFGHYYEIIGEVILMSIVNGDILTSCSISERLLVMTNPQDEEKLLNYFTKTYEPGIKVFSADRIYPAGELISRNLELRIIQDKIHQHNN